MKNTKNILVGAMMAITMTAYANANTAAHIGTREEKLKVTGLNNVLPAALPVLESPAPQIGKTTANINKPTADQKAAIVELKLKSTSAK